AFEIGRLRILRGCPSRPGSEEHRGGESRKESNRMAHDARHHCFLRKSWLGDAVDSTIPQFRRQFKMAVMLTGARFSSSDVKASFPVKGYRVDQTIRGQGTSPV